MEMLDPPHTEHLKGFILSVDFQILLSADIKNLIDQTLHLLATLGMHQARSLGLLLNYLIGNEGCAVGWMGDHGDGG